MSSRVGELQSRLAAVEGGRYAKQWHGKEPAAKSAIQMDVRDNLTAAERAAEQPRKWQLCCRLTAWWTGSAITESWESVHNAELSLSRIETKEDVTATIPRLLAWIQRAMNSGPGRSDHESALKAQLGSSGGFARTSVRAALIDVIAANRERYANLRAFRNTLILITGLLAVLVVVAAAWHAINPDFLSLCSGKGVCVDKSKSPRGTDVALVALVGAVAGLLAIAFAFSEVETAPSRYDPKTWQAFLKPVTGAATALVGVLLIQAEFVAGPVETTQAALLGYATLFGFSQQILTQFVDKRANSLITPNH
jgi:hypothetical protein